MRRGLKQFINNFVTSSKFRAKHGLTSRPLRVDVPAARIDVEVVAADLDTLHQRVQLSWEGLGRKHAHYSVLTQSDFLPERFADNANAFWATGETQTGWLERVLERHGMTTLGSKTCIDFGCGVGRLTLPLAGRFARVHGYDISEPHLEIARQALGRHDNVEFHLVRALPLALMPADVFFSMIVFQHNPPPIIALLIRSALRCLKPGGLAVFQVPTYHLGYEFNIVSYLRGRETKAPVMEMHCIPQAHIFQIVQETGCRVLEVREHDMTGRWGSDVSNIFVVKAGE